MSPRKTSWIIVALFLAAFSGCIRSNEIEGDWKGSNKNGDEWSISRLSDGTFSMSMVTEGSTVTAEGRYCIVGSTHIYTYTKSSDSRWELGRRWYEKVVLLTPTTFKTKSEEDGLVSTERRVDQPPHAPQDGDTPVSKPADAPR